MADTTGTSGAAGGVPLAGQPGKIRNVALVGHSGAGKTTLVEALLNETGTIQRPGRVEEGTTVSDFDEIEVRQGRSVNLTLSPITHAGIKVNLLDTPGYADFTGDLRAGLRAADSALFAVAATEGVDGLTRMLWEECARVGMPRAVVITKIDHQRADFEAALAACREAFGESVAPLYLPVSDGEGSSVRGLIGLLSQKMFDYSGAAARSAAGPGATPTRWKRLRGELIEGIIQESEDESLMDRYLSGEEIDPKVLIEDLEKAVARGSFYPVLAVSSPRGIGMAELLEVMTQAFPSPEEHPMPMVTTLDGTPVTGLSCDPAGPLLAEVVKTTSDPYVGRVSLVRVFSGTLRADAAVHVSGHGRVEQGHADHDTDERIGALTCPLGKQQRRRHRGGGRGHLRRGQAGHRRDRRHAVQQGRAAADGAVGDAGAAAAGRRLGQIQGRRRQDVPGAVPAGRRGPHAAAGEQPRDPPAGAVVHGRGPRRRAAGPAVQPLRRGGGDLGAAGPAAGDDRGQGATGWAGT